MGRRTGQRRSPRSTRALARYTVLGVDTNIAFLRLLLADAMSAPAVSTPALIDRSA